MNRWPCLWFPGILLTSLVTTPCAGSDVLVSCQAFVENAVSSCTCAIRRKSATSPDICGFAVGLVTLTFCEDAGEHRVCYKCIFNDYKIGLVGTEDKGVEVCRHKKYDKEKDLDILEMGVLAHAADHNNSDFRCEPNCLSGKLEQEISGIPVGFSPLCARGKYGELCNMTCHPDCEDGVCDRPTGRCTKETDIAIKIAAGVGVPALVGVCAFLGLWGRRIMECLGLVMDVADIAAKDHDDNDDEDEPTDAEAPDKEKDHASKDSPVRTEDEELGLFEKDDDESGSVGSQSTSSLASAYGLAEPSEEEGTSGAGKSTSEESIFQVRPL